MSKKLRENFEAINSPLIHGSTGFVPTGKSTPLCAGVFNDGVEKKQE
jgi:hypothetical protein